MYSAMRPWPLFSDVPWAMPWLVCRRTSSYDVTNVRLNFTLVVTGRLRGNAINRPCERWRFRWLSNGGPKPSDNKRHLGIKSHLATCPCLVERKAGDQIISIQLNTSPTRWIQANPAKRALRACGTGRRLTARTPLTPDPGEWSTSS